MTGLWLKGTQFEKGEVSEEEYDTKLFIENLLNDLEGSESDDNENNPSDKGEPLLGGN